MLACKWGGRPDLTQHDQIAVHAAGDGARVVPIGRPGEVQSWAVGPPVVLLVPDLPRPLGVVGLTEFVSTPDHRHPAPRVDQRVCEAQGGRRVGDRPLIPAAFGRLQGEQGGGSPARPPVVGRGVVLEDQAGRR